MGFKPPTPLPCIQMSVQGPSGALWGEMSLPLSPQPSCPHTADSHGLGLPAGFLLLLWELGAKTLEAFGRAGLVPVSSFSAVLKSSETRHVPHLSPGVQAEGRVAYPGLGSCPSLVCGQTSASWPSEHSRASNPFLTHVPAEPCRVLACAL